MQDIVVINSLKIVEKEEKAESEKQAEEPMLDIGEPLMKLTKATNNINKCLRENSLNELALQYCMATLQTYLLHHSCNHKHTSVRHVMFSL